MKRIHYIDNLRVACMLYGVFVHTAPLADFGIVEWLARPSNFFRMAAFFLVSGFMGAMLLERQDVRRFLSGRLRNLAVPLVTSLLLLNPITLWLMFRFLNKDRYPDFGWSEVWAATMRRIPAEGPLDWHLHLWFLFSLIFYVLCAPLVSPILQRIVESRPVKSLIDYRNGLFVPVTLALAAAGWVMLHLVVMRVAGRLSIEVPWPVRVTLGNWAFYLMGMLMFMAPRLWSAVHRFDLPLLAVTIAAYVLKFTGVFETGAGVWLLNGLTLTLVRCWLCFTLLHLFERFLNRTSPFFSAMSRSIYTNYLFHYLLIYVVATVYVMFLPLSPAAFFVIAFTTMVLGYLLHIWVIEPVPFLELLFNGRWKRATQTRPAVHQPEAVPIQ